MAPPYGKVGEARRGDSQCWGNARGSGTLLEGAGSGWGGRGVGLVHASNEVGAGGGGVGSPFALDDLHGVFDAEADEAFGGVHPTGGVEGVVFVAAEFAEGFGALGHAIGPERLGLRGMEHDKYEPGDNEQRAENGGGINEASSFARFGVQ